VSKARARLDEWCKDVAPSTELRKWYGHDPELHSEFARRYQEELDGPIQKAALAHLRDLANEQMLTLLTATKRIELSEAAILVQVIG
jgi:uncharacterized protein YeaO (DUF488 family)